MSLMLVTTAPAEDDLCGGRGRPGHGCWMCCSLCNYDQHTCPGCGARLAHGIDVCLRDRNRKD